MKCAGERERNDQQFGEFGWHELLWLSHTLARTSQRFIIKFQLKMHKNEELPLRLMLWKVAQLNPTGKFLWKISQLSVHNLHFWWAIPVIFVRIHFESSITFLGVAKVFFQQFYFTSFASAIFFVSSSIIFFLFFAIFFIGCFKNSQKLRNFFAINLKLHKQFSFTAWKVFLIFSFSFFPYAMCLDSVLIMTIYFPFPYRQTEEDFPDFFLNEKHRRTKKNGKRKKFIGHLIVRSCSKTDFMINIIIFFLLCSLFSLSSSRSRSPLDRTICCG